jgi:hypothetical protein
MKTEADPICEALSSVSSPGSDPDTTHVCFSAASIDFYDAETWCWIGGYLSLISSAL